MTDILQPLFPPTTSTTTAPQPQSQQRTRPTHFHHPHTIYHSQFAQKAAADTSVLPHHVKVAIIERSPARAATSGAGGFTEGGGGGGQFTYRGEKVLIRNEEVYKAAVEKAGGVKGVAERARRRKEILSCGYSADPKEPYKPLGDPTLDTETLLFEALKIDPRSIQSSPNQTVTEQYHKIKHGVESAARRNRLAASSRHASGFTVIKGKLVKSKRLINAVKFGVPFAEICDKEYGRGFGYSTPYSSRFRGGEFGKGKEGAGDITIDWSNLKIDTDKQSYFMNLLEREFPGKVATIYRTKPPLSKPKTPFSTTRTSTPAKGKPKTPQRPPSRAATAAGEEDKDGEAVDVESRLEGPTIRARSRSPTARTPHTLTMKEMEAVLGVSRDEKDATGEFYHTRNQMFEQRDRMTQLLGEDLNWMDYERKANFMRKYTAFHIGKNAIFLDDITTMRRHASAKRSAETSRILRSHPWWTELVTKVISAPVREKFMAPTSYHLPVAGSALPSPTATTMEEREREREKEKEGGGKSAGVIPPPPATREFEFLVVDRIKSTLELSLPITPHTLIQLMRLIPHNEFMKDDIQRIFRFVKQHERISEREYLEAVEMSGQGVGAA
ncbi:hypothetical protein HDV00_001038 [Rhizophlyctis rosea]|nr:hypothetical protein HDV00_001038 [Rhizophlyctis rosea]